MMIQIATSFHRTFAAVHGGKKEYNRNPQESVPKLKSYINVCKICEYNFTTRYQLQKHQKETGHKLKKGRPADSEKN